MKIDQKLYDAALNLLNTRYQPGELAGAAAMYVNDGEIFTSTYNKKTYASLCFLPWLSIPDCAIISSAYGV